MIEMSGNSAIYPGDIRACAAPVDKGGAPLAVDNTLTPVFQRFLASGADIVLRSDIPLGRYTALSAGTAGEGSLIEDF